MNALRNLFGVLLILGGGGLILFGLFGDGDTSEATSPPPPDTRTVSGEVSLPSDGTVELTNSNGDIQVRTWAREAVKYAVTFRATGAPEAAHQAALDVFEGDDSVRLRPDMEAVEKGWSIGFLHVKRSDNIPEVDMRVTVPETARLDLAHDDAEIDVDGTKGALQINTEDGDLFVRNHRGELDISADDGDITLEDVIGAVTLDVDDADVDASGMEGPFSLFTDDGDADVSFTAFTGGVVIDSDDSDITLRLPGRTGFDLTTAFEDDDAELDADVDLSPLRVTEPGDDEAFNYRGAVHGGGPQIVLRGQEPDVRLFTQ